MFIQDRNVAKRDGLTIHRGPTLDRRDIRWFKGIPAVAPARALLDAAADLGDRELEQALASGYRRNILRRSEVQAAIERAPQRRGVPKMRALLAWEHGPAFTRSELEELGLALVRRAGLPEPEVNRSHGPREEVDLIWRRHKFILELDGHAFHSLRPDRERDYIRDQDNQLAGYLTARATGHQLQTAPLPLLVRITRGIYRNSADQPPDARSSSRHQRSRLEP